MPTKVLDLDLAQLPHVIGDVTGYSRGLALLRYKGVPFARLQIPLHGVTLTREHVLAAVAPRLDQPFADAVVSDWLGYDAISRRPLPTATVAVCTRDRPADLARCLASLTNLRQDGQQVLVIDSCSRSDATRWVASEFPHVHYLREERPGLDRARNRALREADTEIVAFIDDDAVADPDWLRTLLRNFDDPEVMCVNGLTMPLELETEAQETSERLFSFARAPVRKVHDYWMLHPVNAGWAGAGVNMALRRRVLTAVGSFDEALDAGTATKSGGDNDMFARILARGYRIAYDPAAVNWHRHRRTQEELVDQAYGYGSGPFAAYAALWLRERDVFVFWVAVLWVVFGLAPGFFRALLKRPGSAPLPVVVAQLRGCRDGVAMYLAERRAQREDLYG